MSINKQSVTHNRKLPWTQTILIHQERYVFVLKHQQPKSKIKYSPNTVWIMVLTPKISNIKLLPSHCEDMKNKLTLWWLLLIISHHANESWVHEQWFLPNNVILKHHEFYTRWDVTSLRVISIPHVSNKLPCEHKLIIWISIIALQLQTAISGSERFWSSFEMVKVCMVNFS